MYEQIILSPWSVRSFPMCEFMALHALDKESEVTVSLAGRT